MRIAVVGGGAAGLFAAASVKLNRPEAAVVVLEKQDRVGKKLLATGNGRCNLTATRDAEDLSAYCRAYSDPAAARRALSRFGVNATLERFARLGLAVTVEQDGSVYPASYQASSVLDCLRQYLSVTGAVERTGVRVEAISGSIGNFKVAGERFDRVIVATGGPAQVAEPRSVFFALSALGHTVRPLLPCLVPLKCDSTFLKGTGGVRVRAVATLLLDGKEAAAERGEVLFRDYGVSGIAVFQLSHALACARERGFSGRASLRLDLFPEGVPEALLAGRKRLYGALPAAEFFTGVMNRRVGQNVLTAAGIPPDATISGLSLPALMRAARNLELGEVRPLPFDKAQASVGGVPAEETDECFQSRRVPGLYLAGEVLDVTGRCGGYNLQWAWSTAAIAGESAVDSGK